MAHGAFFPMNCVKSWVILNIPLDFYLLWFVCACTGKLLVSLGLAEPSSPTWVNPPLCIVDRVMVRKGRQTSC